MSVSVETEMKFSLKNFNNIKEIYNLLSDTFIVHPYDKTMLYDIYYDSERFDLLKNGYTYRIRNKRNRSINFKTKGEVICGLLSRFEYRDAVDKKSSLDEILEMNCETNTMVKNVFALQGRTDLVKKVILCSYRTSFLMYYKDGNDIKKFGVCSFDKYFEKNEKKVHYEIEIESCDEELSSHLFMGFIMIKEKFDLLGLKNSSANKYSVLMKDLGVKYE